MNEQTLVVRLEQERTLSRMLLIIHDLTDSAQMVSFGRGLPPTDLLDSSFSAIRQRQQNKKGKFLMKSFEQVRDDNGSSGAGLLMLDEESVAPLEQTSEFVQF